ncbi:1,6-didemethyltoxoflavin N1-methyltransferase [Actinomycetospora corticicola]|uniref:SAM-dependent methyltransferase n=1 Tax=Actinomycetospora corticicola TaxID=663602 RepID=A0A7Y9J3Z0_9PSEU|nr:class I SAM-dependent methyltransferase [Actinomycetospora corticicola]NYD34507.1 SAM-dependent methyltransferase [Actinomycetospora corticicola]
MTRSTDPGTAHTGYADYRDTVASSFRSAYDAHRDRWTDDPVAAGITDFAVAAVRRHRPGAPYPDPAVRLLDIGAGRGHQSAVLAERLGADVTAVDLLPVADATAPRRGRVRHVVGDFLDLAPADGRYDVLLDNGCLHHQRPEDWARFVAHGRRLLADDGLWVLCTFLSPGPEVAFHDQADGRHNVWFTPDDLQELFTTAGLVRVDETVLDRRFAARGFDLAYLLQTFVVGGAG